MGELKYGKSNEDEALASGLIRRCSRHEKTYDPMIGCSECNKEKEKEAKAKGYIYCEIHRRFYKPESGCRKCHVANERKVRIEGLFANVVISNPDKEKDNKATMVTIESKEIFGFNFKREDRKEIKLEKKENPVCPKHRCKTVKKQVMGRSGEGKWFYVCPKGGEKFPLY